MRRFLAPAFTLLLVVSLWHEPAGAASHKAVLLMAAQSEQGTVVTYGQNGRESGPLSRAIAAPFEKAGIELVSTKTLPMSPASDSRPGLPMGDSSATSIARAAGAEIAIVVGIVASSEGPLRATELVGQAVSVQIRVLSVASGRSVFDGKSRAASYGREATMARAQGSSKAIAKATRGLVGTLMEQWPSRRETEGRLSLSITGADGWRAIAAIIRSLAATRGVTGVHALQIHPERVVLSLQSQQGAAQVVASLRRARIHNGSLTVQLSGTSLVVRIVMNTPGILPPIRNG